MNIPSTIIGVIGAGLVLALTILGMINSRAAAKKKEVEDEAKKIDSCANADDVVRELGRLRNK